MNKTILLLLLALLAACKGQNSSSPPPAVVNVTSAANGGSEGVGGGDTCEREIKSIRDNIAGWIQQHSEYKKLQLLNGMTSAQYHDQMMKYLVDTTKIACVGQNDHGYPVQIGNAPKICIWQQTATSNQITCDSDKFLGQSQKDQLLLVHHEFAGLAGVEPPDGSSSVYTVSQQVVDHGRSEVVFRLPVNQGMNFSVNPGSFYADPGLDNQYSSPTLILGRTSSDHLCVGDMCDSCAAMKNTPMTAKSVCGLREVHETTQLTFTFDTDERAEVGSTIYAKILAGNQIVASSPVAIWNPGQSVSVVVPLATLWKAMGQPTGKISIADSITVGWGNDQSSNFIQAELMNFKYRYADASMSAAATFGCSNSGAYEGLCGFNVYPGDSKAYVTPINMITSSDYAVPNLSLGGSELSADTSGIIYYALRFYYIHTNSKTPAIFTVAGGGVLGESYYQDITVANGMLQAKAITGLKNFAPGSTDEYQFAAASIDQAGIVSYFMLPNALNFALTPTGSTQAVQPHP